jgi:ABC-type lipoprotein export system ATPase subunit
MSLSKAVEARAHVIVITHDAALARVPGACVEIRDGASSETAA